LMLHASDCHPGVPVWPVAMNSLPGVPMAFAKGISAEDSRLISSSAASAKADEAKGAPLAVCRHVIVWAPGGIRKEKCCQIPPEGDETGRTWLLKSSCSSAGPVARHQNDRRARPVRDPAKLRCSGRMTTRDAYRHSPESKNGSCRNLKRTAANSASELSPGRLPKWSEWLIRWGRARKAGRDLRRDQFLPTDAMPDTPAVAPAGLASTAPRAADLFTTTSRRNSTTRAAWPGWRGGPSGGIRRGRWRR
jgi:hypothetical protein